MLEFDRSRFTHTDCDGEPTQRHPSDSHPIPRSLAVKLARGHAALPVKLVRVRGLWSHKDAECAFACLVSVAPPTASTIESRLCGPFSCPNLFGAACDLASDALEEAASWQRHCLDGALSPKQPEENTPHP